VKESAVTKGTRRGPAAAAPHVPDVPGGDGGELGPGVRAALAGLPDEALLARVRALPKDSELRAAACEVLVGRYHGLVRACVRPYRASPEPAEDLLQAGYVGLLKAINNYDPALGASLPGYAQPCVSGEIKRHFRDKRWQVHVRRSAQELALDLRRATADLAQALGRAPADADLAAQLGLTAEDLAAARQAGLAFTPASLDAPLSAPAGHGDPAVLADTLGDEDPGLDHALDMAAVRAHWDELPRRDQQILILRYYGNLTQTQIGHRLGISQMHVSRLLARALAHLRSRLLDTTDGDPPTSTDADTEEGLS
jgi:RNA polymerase sigma-B factor